MKKLRNYFLILFLLSCLNYGCSVRSVVKNSIETTYKIAVDERPLRHIINDKKLTSLIQAELLQDDVTNILDIKVACFFGYPFVVGECDDIEEAKRVVKIAKDITGKNPIPYLVKKEKVKGCNAAINFKITTEINTRLLADKKIFKTNVSVESVQCKAILLGVLGSKEYILNAMEHAENTGGVQEVISFLVSTDTNRSWDSVFQAMGEIATEMSKKSIIEGEEEKDEEK